MYMGFLLPWGATCFRWFLWLLAVIRWREPEVGGGISWGTRDLTGEFIFQATEVVEKKRSFDVGGTRAEKATTSLSSTPPG
jgi:hypothetical protein